MAVFGDYTGGELKVWPRDNRCQRPRDLSAQDANTVDTHDVLLLFDGSKAHQALPADGRRFSVLWYTTGKWDPMTTA
eukprot:2611843-Prorocentrum_lima.AAC.1